MFDHCLPRGLSFPAVSLVTRFAGFFLLGLAIAPPPVQAGLVTGIEASASVFTFNFNFNFTLPDTTNSTQNFQGTNSHWIGTYRETVNDFRLDMRSGAGVDFDNWDDELDLYQLNIGSLWSIQMEVRLRDATLIDHEDIFKFDGTLKHTAGENLPHPGDSKDGHSSAVGFNAKAVKEIRLNELVTINNPAAGGLLGGIQGTFWQYHTKTQVTHPNILGDHSDSYEVYFLGDVDVETDAMTGYRILMSGQHNGFRPVPEASTYAWGAIGLLGITMAVRQRRRRALAG